MIFYADCQFRDIAPSFAGRAPSAYYHEQQQARSRLYLEHFSIIAAYASGRLPPQARPSMRHTPLARGLVIFGAAVVRLSRHFVRLYFIS